MSNTRAINRRAEREFAKRQRSSLGGSYHDRVPLDSDLEVVHSREAHLTAQRGYAVETPRSPQRGRTTWAIGDTWAPIDDREIGLDPNGEWHDEEFARDGIGAPPEPNDSPVPLRKAKKTRVSVCRTPLSQLNMLRYLHSQRRPHVIWKELHRESYLNEMLRWEGRGDFRTQADCPDCTTRAKDAPGDAEYRCLDCFIPDLICSACCVRRHRAHPLHCIEVC